MEVKKMALDRAIALLNASGCQWAIVTPEGVKHGNLNVAPPEDRKRRKSEFPRGTFKEHFDGYIKGIAAGQSNIVPFGRFAESESGRASLQKAIASHCSHAWGNGSYITHMNGAGVEVLRIE